VGTLAAKTAKAMIQTRKLPAIVRPDVNPYWLVGLPTLRASLLWLTAGMSPKIPKIPKIPNSRVIQNVGTRLVVKMVSMTAPGDTAGSGNRVAVCRVTAGRRRAGRRCRRVVGDSVLLFC